MGRSGDPRREASGSWQGGGKEEDQTDSYLPRDAEIFQLLTTSAIIQTGTSWIPALARTQRRDGCSAHRRSCQRDLSYTTSSLPPFPDHRGGTSNILSSTFTRDIFKHPENQNLIGNIVYPLPRCYCWHFLFCFIMHLSLCPLNLNSSAGTQS